MCTHRMIAGSLVLFALLSFAAGQCFGNIPRDCAPCWCQPFPPSIAFQCPAGSGCHPPLQPIIPDGYYFNKSNICRQRIPCPVGAYCMGGGCLLWCPAGTQQPLTMQGAAAACQPCAAGYIQPTPAATSCFACPAGTYNPLTGQSAGLACLSCPGGRWSSQPGQSQCQQCPLGTYNSLTGQTSISACQNCLPGFYANTTSNPFCTPCGAGTYQSGSRATSATQCVQCSAGSFNSALGQLTCQLCSPGTFSTVIGAVNAASCRKCPVGTFQPAMGQSSPASCLDCAPGFFNQFPGQFMCSPCNAGTYSPMSGAYSSANCTDCPAGNYCPQSSINPSPCPSGTFSSATGGKTVQTCQPCPSGFFCAFTSTTTPDQCVAGYYCPQRSINPRPCDAGKYSNTLGASSEAQCVLCSPGQRTCAVLAEVGLAGKYSALTGQLVCQSCPAGTANAQQAASSPAACVPCSPGSFAPFTASSSCTPCPLGTASSVSGQLSSQSCLACVPGRFGNATGLAACFLCPQGTFLPTPGQQSAKACRVCPSSARCPAGSASPSSACEPGYYIAKPAEGVCVPCAPGYFCPYGQNTMIPCPAGGYCPQFSTAPTFCPNGTYNIATQTTVNMSCVVCDAGYYCVSGAPKTPCSKGTYSASPSAAFCSICPQGFMAAHVASTKCDACVGGLCPLGSSNALSTDRAARFQPKDGQPPPTIVHATSDPLKFLTDKGQQAALKAQIAIGCAASVVILTAAILYGLSRRRFKNRFQKYLKPCDAFEMDHFFGDSVFLKRKKRALGGLFTILGVCTSATLLCLLLIQSQLVINHTQAISPLSPPFNPFGLFNFSVTLIGAPGCANPVIQPPEMKGSSTHSSVVGSDGSLAMAWTCPLCSAASPSLITTFSVADDNCYAAAIEFSATFPGYTTSPTSASYPPYVLSGSVLPDVPLSTVFRGQTFSTFIQLSMVAVFVHDDPQHVGTFSQLLDVYSGSQINSTAFDASKGVTVQIHVEISSLMYDVVPLSQTVLSILAEAGSFVSTVAVISKLLMNRFERMNKVSARSESVGLSETNTSQPPAEPGDAPIAAPRRKTKQGVLPGDYVILSS